MDFSYVKDQPLIEDFSLDVKPGNAWRLSVQLEAEETTVINLLMRFYGINGGKLAIDGHSIEDISVIHCEMDLEWCFKEHGFKRYSA